MVFISKATEMRLEESVQGTEGAEHLDIGKILEAQPGLLLSKASEKESPVSSYPMNAQSLLQCREQLLI